MTYNIHQGVGTDLAYNMNRIIDVCQDANPDILAIQEIPEFISTSRKQVTAELFAERLNMHYVQAMNVSVRRKIPYGNAIISRFPIREYDNLNITWTIKKKRSCLNATIELPTGHQLAIMNFHLGLAGIERRMQLKKILHSYFFLSHKENPVVMLGDTNDVYNRLMSYASWSGFQDIYARESKSRTFPSYAPIWRLDRIYHSEALDLVDKSIIKNPRTRLASDHLPLVAKFRVVATSSIINPERNHEQKNS